VGQTLTNEALLEGVGGVPSPRGFSPETMMNVGDFHLKTLVNIQKTMEDHHRNSGFSHEKWVDFP